MFVDNTQGAGASNVPPADNSLPDYPCEFVHHTLRGSLVAIRNTIKLLHKLNRMIGVCHYHLGDLMR